MNDYLDYADQEKMVEQEIARIKEDYNRDPLSVEAVLIGKFPPKQPKKKWLGSIEGRECDLCDAALTFQRVFFDARTKSGRWGLLCPTCWLNNGVGLGIGQGQMYDSRTLEKIDPEKVKEDFLRR